MYYQNYTPTQVITSGQKLQASSEHYHSRTQHIREWDTGTDFGLKLKGKQEILYYHLTQTQHSNVLKKKSVTFISGWLRPHLTLFTTDQSLLTDQSTRQSPGGCMWRVSQCVLSVGIHEPMLWPWGPDKRMKRERCLATGHCETVINYLTKCELVQVTPQQRTQTHSVTPL